MSPTSFTSHLFAYYQLWRITCICQILEIYASMHLAKILNTCCVVVVLYRLIDVSSRVFISNSTYKLCLGWMEAGRDLPVLADCAQGVLCHLKEVLELEMLTSTL